MNCKHIWKHKVIKGKCMDKGCKIEHEWLIHLCKICRKRAAGLKIK